MGSKLALQKENAMASPFPGMDPFLEGEMWQEFHETLASAIRVQLLGKLGAKYVALLAKRYVLNRPSLGIFDAPTSRVVYPDVHIIAEARPAYAVRPTASAVGMTPVMIPVLEQAWEPAAEVISPVWERVPQLSVEIRDIAQRRLVTVIELLSPANKQGEGYREYADRRLDLMQTATHLLEIDLLRGGQRLELYGHMPSGDYYVYLSRFQQRPRTQVWPIHLRDALPTVPVPLLPPDADVTLDIQAAVDGCFALVGYERLLNYIDPLPPPALEAEDAAWVQECLAQAIRQE
jgi:hypothetical protein